MKAKFFPSMWLCSALGMVGLAGWTGIAVAETEQPVISSVYLEETNVVVIAEVPAGIEKVTLECRERAGHGSWEPRAVARLSGDGGRLTFRLPVSRRLEVVRIRADAKDVLPAWFYTGPSTFLGEPTSGPDAVPSGMYRLMYMDALAPTTTTEGTGDATREVVESDIWKIRDQTLYYFNQLRGLQVINLSDPDAPVLTGTFELPAAGEQMYLLGSRHVVLLAGESCSSSGTQSRIWVLEDTQGVPAAVASLPVPGSITESRLVGTALYVASQIYRSVTGSAGTTWEWGTVVSSFDLSVAESATARGSLWYAGYGQVVSATDRLFFVATQDPANGGQSIVRTIDITSPDGTMRDYESIRVAGLIKDKFKLDYQGSVLTTISENWMGGARGLVTILETFRLPDPRSMGMGPVGVVKLGELKLGEGEQLHATRFDGEKVYVVTFFRVDPLWVVSLADPADPKWVGHLEIPGWSTYIEPLGDRLVAVGVETNRVAVSLFNVSDPSAPTLASKVVLGDQYSYSEANFDEKAFTVLPGASLILLPYSGYETGGYASRVQLIDLQRDALVTRGVIEHDFQPRRATVYSDRILSISGWEFLTVDATDRDHPVVVQEMTLAWSVDRVFLKGDYLVELSESTNWRDQGPPSVRVAPAAAPNEVVQDLALGDLPVLGAAVRGNHLYVAQGIVNRYWYYIEPLATADGGEEIPKNKIVLTVVSLEHLPQLAVTGAAERETDMVFWSGQVEALWPTDNVLVWVMKQSYAWWRYPGPIVLDTLAVPGAMGMRLWYPYWGGSGGQLIAFDVTDPNTPAFASEVNLNQDGSWWDLSSAFAANGLVYLSHRAVEYVGGTVPTSPAPVVPTAPDPTVVVTDPGYTTYPLVKPIGTWTHRSYLDVIDYADPKAPLVRKPVNIPGQLTGISRGGAIIYTIGINWAEDGTTDWVEHLSASAYDPPAVRLIDSMELPKEWPHPLLVVGENIFFGQPGSSAQGQERPAALEVWTLPDTGQFTKLGELPLNGAASVLASFPGLLALQHADQSVVLADSSDPADLKVVGSGQTQGCLWFDLTRADGRAGRGLWIPLGAYGVSTIPVSTKANAP